MKTAILKNIPANRFTGTGELAGRSYEFTNHRYSLPAERSYDYNKILNERDARNPESLLEPEQGAMLAADVDYEYNYYVAEYERLRGTELLYHEHLLPSLNMFLADKEGLIPEGEALDNYYSVFGVGGRLHASFVQHLALSRDYFVDFGMHAKLHYQSSPPPSYATMPAKNEFVNKKMRDLYLDNENKREHFPYFGKISVEGFENSQLANIFEDYRLDNEFVGFLQMHRFEVEKTMEYEYSDNVLPVPTIVQTTVSISSLNTFYKHVDEGHGGEVIEYGQTDENQCTYFENFLLTNLAKTKIQRYIDNSEIGTSTPMAFRLEKLDPRDERMLEVYYFFNYKDMSNFKFFDTRVHYDKTYEYRIKIINAIVARSLTDGGKELFFVEENFYQDTFFILDSPPIPPDIELITYRGVSDKLLILFNQMVDKRAMVPININESDLESFDRQYQSQKIDKPDPIIFESDDPTDFELFKCMKHPSDYSEFANTMYRVIRTGGLTAGSYTDTIIPNQTYYYMFRALDLHGFPSNPSPIYEFTLIKEGETMYPKIRTVELRKPDPPTQKSKSFKRYLKIILKKR